MNKKPFLAMWLGLSIGLVVISIGVVLYQKTEFFKKLIEWWNWFWNGLRNFNWE